MDDPTGIPYLDDPVPDFGAMSVDELIAYKAEGKTWVGRFRDRMKAAHLVYEEKVYNDRTADLVKAAHLEGIVVPVSHAEFKVQLHAAMVDASAAEGLAEEGDA